MTDQCFSADAVNVPRGVSRRTLLIGSVAGSAIAAALGGSRSVGPAAQASGHHQTPAASPVVTGEPAVHELTLTAGEFQQELMPGVTTAAWGYNGQVPGPEIRVTEGDTLRVTLKNALPAPTTIHWHGVHLPPAMDGPAGLNQVAVAPGEEFVYEFIARPSGTRWYHSHADPQLQVPMGLYGPLIIEPRDPADATASLYDREHLLMLSEWDSELTPDVAAGRAERGPKDQALRGGELGADMFLINGKAHGAIPPLTVAEGERVLIRIINAGSMAHPVHGHGHSFRLVATDGNPVPVAAQWVKDTFLIGPAERVDLAFDADNPGVWMFHCHIEHHMANGMMTVIAYEGVAPSGPAAEFIDLVEGRDAHAGHDAPPSAATAAPTPSRASTGDMVPPKATTVSMVDDRFEPVTLQVAAGTTVTWTNNGADWHSVAAYDGSFESDKLAPGESFSFTFTRPGTCKYICKHHGLQGMIGQVIVT